MRNKTTYEMDDVMNLIAKDLADKGLAPDPASIEIWACVDGARVSAKEIEVEVSVSWVGIPARVNSDPSSPRAHPRHAPGSDPEAETSPPDLLAEAPSPRNRPALAIGDIGEPPGTVEDITAAGAKIARAGGAGPFAPERVRRRLSADETHEWPGNVPPGGR